MLTKMILETWEDDDRELKMWVFGNSPALIESHGPTLVNALTAVHDFIPNTPLLVFPVSLPERNGEVFRRHYFLKPVHIIEGAPDIFIINEKFIEIYSGIGDFFADVASQTQKIMNTEVLQALHNERHLHVVGVYTEPTYPEDTEMAVPEVLSNDLIHDGLQIGVDLE